MKVVFFQKLLVGGWSMLSQPNLKNMLVKMDHETPNRDEQKKIFETTS